MPPNTRILIIDDSKSVHSFVRESLREWGAEIVSTFDGRQGLFHLQKDSDFSLILLDWEMPVMDGPATLAQLQALCPTVPVSMMTSRNSLDEISRMLAMGASEYLMKPFTKEILLEKIQRLKGAA